MIKSVLVWVCAALTLASGCASPPQEEGPDGEQASPDLGAALLQVDDLPGEGWTRDQNTAQPLKKECGPVISRPTGDGVVGAAYTKGQFKDQLVQSAEEFDSPDGARAAIAELKEAAATCPPWSEEVDGANVRTRLSPSPADAPALGDEAVAYRVVTTIEGEGYEAFSVANAVAIRRQNVVSTVTHFVVNLKADPQLDGSVIADVAGKADQKLVAAGF